MAKTGPGLYSEIGKQARDLLYRDYQTDQKFTLSTVTADGIAITTSGTRKIDENIIGEIQSRLKANKNVTVDVKATSNSNLFTTVTIDELATPGLKSIFSFVVPDQKSGKVELQYLHDYAGVNASIGLTANPVVNLSSVFGTKALAVGADVSLDTATGNFIKYNAGVNVTLTDAIASLAVGWNIRCMDSGHMHHVVGADDSCISWGFAQYGELGYGPHGQKSSANPKKIESLNNMHVTRPYSIG